MSPALYRELFKLGAVVFYGKGIRDPETREDLFGEFIEKRLLKFPETFYLRLSTSSDKQIRSYVAFAINKTVLDFFRRQGRLAHEKNKGTEEPEAERETSQTPVNHEAPRSRELALTDEEYEMRDLPEILRQEYKLMARTVYACIWERLKPEQQEIFCLLYNGGRTTQEIAQLKGLSLGTVQNNKERIAKIAHEEAEVREIAELAYQLMALSCCTGPHGQSPPRP